MSLVAIQLTCVTAKEEDDLGGWIPTQNESPFFNFSARKFSKKK